MEDPSTQITPAEALQRSGEELEVGDEYVEIVNLGKDFGRRLIVTAKQNLNQRIREIENRMSVVEPIYAAAQKPPQKFGPPPKSASASNGG